MRLTTCLVLPLALAGCGLVLDLDPPDQPAFDGGVYDSGAHDSGVHDAGPPRADAGSECEGVEDGVPCDDGRCVDGRCVRASCGDGFVDPPEECDDANDRAGDGCEPGSCIYSCVTASDCGASTGCAASSCVDHVCVFEVMAEGSACALGGQEGRCMGGVCAPFSCGNGVIDPGEGCDDGNASTADGCDPGCVPSCSSDADCDDAIHCNGVETCAVIELGALCVRSVAPIAPPCMICSRESGDFVLIDADGDGYAPSAAGTDCGPTGGDCDDHDASVHPGASDPRAASDGVDQDCDGMIDEDVSVRCLVDADGDGWGRGDGAIEVSSACPPGYTPATRDDAGSVVVDCDDEDPNVFPTQGAWFSASRCPSGAPGPCFDYDCDAVDEPRYRRVICVIDVTGRECDGQGFVDLITPACGEVGTFATCVPDAIGRCTTSATTARLTQECH